MFVFQKLCFSSDDSGRVETIVRENMESIEGMSLDWLTGNLYWVDAGTNGTQKIEVARSDGRHRRRLIDRQHLDRPRAVITHPQSGYAGRAGTGHGGRGVWYSAVCIEKVGVVKGVHGVPGRVGCVIIINVVDFITIVAFII